MSSWSLLCGSLRGVVMLDKGSGALKKAFIRLFTSVMAGSDLGRAEVGAEEADPYERTMKYLESHNILQIFQEITARLVYDRPDDPLRFMVEQLQKMIEAREEWNKAA